MNIELDAQAAESVVRALLRLDLKMITDDLKKAKKDKKYANLIGVDDYKRYAEAIKTLQEWYGE